MDKYIQYIKNYLKIFKITLIETHKKAKQQVLCDSCVAFKQPSECSQVLCSKYKFKPIQLSTKRVSETYYDTSLGEYVNTKDVDRICKEKGLVYGTIEETDKDAKSNREHHKQISDREFSRQLNEELTRALR